MQKIRNSIYSTDIGKIQEFAGEVTRCDINRTSLDRTREGWRGTCYGRTTRDSIDGTSHGASRDAHCSDRITDINDYDTKDHDGTRDRVDGTRDRVDGTSDRVDGTRDRVDGTSDRVDGTRDRVDGARGRAADTYHYRNKNSIDKIRQHYENMRGRFKYYHGDNGAKTYHDKTKAYIDGHRARLSGTRTGIDEIRAAYRKFRSNNIKHNANNETNDKTKASSNGPKKTDESNWTNTGADEETGDSNDTGTDVMSTDDIQEEISNSRTDINYQTTGGSNDEDCDHAIPSQ